MTTKCTTEQLAFQGLGRREVVGRFDGGEISSDGGGLLLREVEQRTQILRRLSQCFTDRRDPARIEHALESLVKQRVLGIALGYEDLNDHDELCRDSVLALLSGYPGPFASPRKTLRECVCGAHCWPGIDSGRPVR